MTWFKVDDNLAFHAKVVAAGNPAMGLWVRAGSWSAHTLTDGHVPKHMVSALGTTQQAKALVTAGLWVETDEGYRFHQWADGDRQPTRAAVEAKREEWKEKKRRQRRGDDGQFVPEMSPGDSPEDMPESPLWSPAVPSRPVPSSSVETKSKSSSTTPRALRTVGLGGDS